MGYGRPSFPLLRRMARLWLPLRFNRLFRSRVVCLSYPRLLGRALIGPTPLLWRLRLRGCSFFGRALCLDGLRHFSPLFGDAGLFFRLSHTCRGFATLLLGTQGREDRRLFVRCARRLGCGPCSSYSRIRLPGRQQIC